MEILSTYRLQFHKGFTFRDAAAIVPYLHGLGVTHVYASPYLKAVAGSTHGYDVIDHSQLNPEVGTLEDYQFFVATLTKLGMSHILDTVPNHMGVDTNENPWWNDVLENGPGGKFGQYFDIDWNEFPPRSQLLDKVLLPVLGESYGQVLEKKQLQLRREQGKLFVYYYDRRFPINGEIVGELHDLLEKQHYRICHWRVAADEINYRRFFDVTSLAALKMERQEVFDAAHDFTFSLIAQGSVAGLRVDHPDGLLDPKKYFARLQDKFRTACPEQAAGGNTLFVSVEKILNGDERLREDWAVSGTSGYDFLCAVNDLFVSPENEQRMTAVYSAFVGDATSYADYVYQMKCKILDTSLCSELTALSRRLDALAQLALSSRDFTLGQLRGALRELIACFPVYRTYVSDQGATDADAQVMGNAMTEAVRRNPMWEASLLQFVHDSVLLRHPVPAAARAAQLAFAQRFQQLTSPVNAKGIEDTTFYIYNRLASLNEVGGDPGRFGRKPEEIHRYFQHRNDRWPQALSSLSTHDTKRSEDVRARINVLSEIPDEWSNRLERWKGLNSKLCASVHPNDQYLLYQTLLGAWPLESMDDEARSAFAERINAYMQKAMREAKQRTGWTSVNKDYEAAVASLVAGLIHSPEFLEDFLPFQQKVSRLGMINSLAQTVVRLTAPGIADTYQGTELWDFSLVDPDNRRAVDYGRRAELLKKVNEPIGDFSDNLAKLRVTSRLLHLRRQIRDVFLKGKYQPVSVTGSKSASILAFSKSSGDQFIITVVPRVAVFFEDKNSRGDIKLVLPESLKAGSVEDVISGRVYQHREIGISEIFQDFPAAVLRSVS